MSLWGNNDNLFSGGTVALNYNNKTVTGTGTTFGTVGAAKTGDVIRFGARGGGAAAYFGDAVVVSIASTISLTHWFNCWIKWSSNIRSSISC